MKHRSPGAVSPRKCAILAISAVLFLTPYSNAQGVASSIGPQPSAQDPEPIWSVTVPYETSDDIQRLSTVIDHMRIDEDAKTVTIEVDTAAIDAIRALGFNVEIDSQASQVIQEFRGQRRDFLNRQKSGAHRPNAFQGSPQSKPGDPLFAGNAACYRTVEKTNLDIDALAKQYPHLIRVVPIGQTWVQKQALSFRNLLIKYLPASVLALIDFDLLPDSSANAIRVVVIGNKAVIKDRKVPRMVTTSSIHAREYTPAEISARFTEWLVTSYGTDATATWLLNNNEFHFILHANPDGRKLAEQAVGSWRKNANLEDAFCKGQPLKSGVDLNRNFPFGWNSTKGAGSSGSSCAETYRGKTAASEPETEAIVKYVAGTRQASGDFVGGVLPDRRTAAVGDFGTGAPNDYEGLYIDIHSFSQLVLWPWGIRRASIGGTSQTANDDGMAAFGQRMAWYNKYRATQMINYNVDGATTDTFYGELGAPSFTIELGKSFYEPCKEFEKETLPRNIASLRYAARTLKAPYQLPLGPDAVDLKLSANVVRQGQPVTLNATIDDDRYRYDKGFNGNQAPTKHDPQPIKAANAYINLLPWDSGAKAIALKPVDGGAFGAAPKTTVSGVIDTAALKPGKHLIYVQGANQKGQAGPPDAVFLKVIPKDAPEPCPPK